MPVRSSSRSRPTGNSYTRELHRALSRLRRSSAPAHLRADGEAHAVLRRGTRALEPLPVQACARGARPRPPHFPDLDEESAMQRIWFTVAPSFSIEIYPDHIAMFKVEPCAPDRSRERISIFLAPATTSPPAPHRAQGPVTLRTVAPNPLASNPCIAQLSGFSFHAGTRHQRPPRSATRCVRRAPCLSLTLS